MKLFGLTVIRTSKYDDLKRSFERLKIEYRIMDKSYKAYIKALEDGTDAREKPIEANRFPQVKEEEV